MVGSYAAARRPIFLLITSLAEKSGGGDIRYSDFFTQNICDIITQVDCDYLNMIKIIVNMLLLYEIYFLFIVILLSLYR